MVLSARSFSALATLGALFGTFGIGFIFVAAVPTRPLVLGLGALEILVGMLMLLPILSRGRVAAAVMALLASTALLAGIAGPCQFQTRYYCAVITQDQGRPSGRVLTLDTLPHSYVDLAPCRLYRWRRVHAAALREHDPRWLDARPDREAILVDDLTDQFVGNAMVLTDDFAPVDRLLTDART